MFLLSLRGGLRKVRAKSSSPFGRDAPHGFNIFMFFLMKMLRFHCPWQQNRNVGGDALEPHGVLTGGHKLAFCIEGVLKTHSGGMWPRSCNREALKIAESGFLINLKAKK